jgi:catalase
MSSALISDLLAILDEISGGVHAGFRPAHAKGLICIGNFSPSPEVGRSFGKLILRVDGGSKP